MGYLKGLRWLCDVGMILGDCYFFYEECWTLGMTAGGLSFLLNICVAGFLRRVGMSVIMWGFFLGKACRRLLSLIVVACERVVLLFPPPPHGGQKTAVSARL